LTYSPSSHQSGRRQIWPLRGLSSRRYGLGRAGGNYTLVVVQRIGGETYERTKGSSKSSLTLGENEELPSAPSLSLILPCDLSVRQGELSASPRLPRTVRRRTRNDGNVRQFSLTQTSQKPPTKLWWPSLAQVIPWESRYMTLCHDVIAGCRLSPPLSIGSSY